MFPEFFIAGNFFLAPVTKSQFSFISDPLRTLYLACNCFLCFYKVIILQATTFPFFPTDETKGKKRENVVVSAVIC